ncbi:MAG: HAD-IIIA family hydrolase [Candidatus Zixiibacteriota bacterium]
MRRKILIVRFSSLGDIILTSPFVLNLKINFPDSVVCYLTKEKYKPLVAAFDGVDKIVTLDEKVPALGYYKLLNELDRENFDTIVDLHGNFRSWLAGKMITADRKVIYPKRRLERLRIVRKKQIPRQWPHTIDLYNDCIRQLRGRIYARRPVIRARPEYKIGTIDFSGDSKYVFIAPGAAHPDKQWGLDKFAEVARRLFEYQGCKIIWSVLAGDKGKFNLREKIPPESFIELVDYPVEKLKDIIARCRLTLANDSGLAHLSSAVAVPVLAVFGPTHPALGFSPRGLHDRVVEVDEPCRPCSLHGKKPCYREERFCLNRISVEMVYEAAKEMLLADPNKFPAIFFDRDGTVVVDKDYLADPEGVEFEKGAVEALKLAVENKYKIVIVSNQSGVARGFFTLDEVERVNARLLEMLARERVNIDAVYYCPHHPKGKVDEFTSECFCRKPGPGMAEEAARTLKLDLRRSAIIGDTSADVNFGRVNGMLPLLVRTGYGRKTEQKLSEVRHLNEEIFAFDNLLEAVQYIVGMKKE